MLRNIKQIAGYLAYVGVVVVVIVTLINIIDALANLSKTGELIVSALIIFGVTFTCTFIAKRLGVFEVKKER